jgi:hypothetical protein
MLQLFVTGVGAQQLALPDPSGADNLTAIRERQRIYFADRGTERGTGYRQYKRWESFVAPRSIQREILLISLRLRGSIIIGLNGPMSLGLRCGLVSPQA